MRQRWLIPDANSLLPALLVVLLTGHMATAQETLILDALRAAEDTATTKLALPEAPGDAAAEPPGSTPQASQGGSFFENLTAEQEAEIVDKAYPLMSAKWPFNQVFVCWETMSEEQIAEREIVRNAVRDTWDAASGLKFVGWGSCAENSRGVRIAVNDEGPHVKVLGKYLDGRRKGMVLNFTYRNWGTGCLGRESYCTRVIAVHEFGHAIGFAHEQNRPDTPGECDERQGADGDTINLTPWDPQSVMNYCNPAYNNDGVLSAFDILAVRYIYGED